MKLAVATAIVIGRWHLPVKNNVAPCRALRQRSEYELLDKDTLCQLYLIEECSMSEIARECCVHQNTVRGWLDKFGIPIRSLSDQVRITWAKPGAKDRVLGKRNPMKREEVVAKFRGEANPSKRPEVNQKKTETRIRNGTLFLKGGRLSDPDGYILVRQPNHPHANSAGYVREHRLVMEDVLGRFLSPTEVVHHKNRDRADNRVENLQLCADKAEHTRIHLDEMIEKRKRSLKST